jgi:hypothetical protein
VAYKSIGSMDMNWELICLVFVLPVAGAGIITYLIARKPARKTFRTKDFK